MDVRLAIIFCVISLGTQFLCVSPDEEADKELQKAVDILMNAGVSIDLESTHIEDLHGHDDLPAAYRRVLDSLRAEAETCDPNETYRRTDGVCNNLQNPLQGAVLHYQQRLLPNAYMDGVGIPRMVDKNGHYLASARTVSVQCFPENKETRKYLDKKTTQMSMQWGQYIDHDVVFTEVMKGGGCCSDPEHICVHPDSFLGGPCFPIEIPPGDRYFNESCMNFKRSFSIIIDDVHEQITGVTSFVDASTVYGSNQAHQDMLRTHVGGLLKTTDKNMLPNQGPFNCRKDIAKVESCPHAGDGRVNVFPGLTAVHVLFVREHNRLAEKLCTLNPQWDDERIFQETRRIIIALHQIITYEEYLPHVVGDDAMDFFNLKPGNFKYEPETNPAILNEFAVAAFRFGHSQINACLKTSKKKPISEMYFQPWETMESEKNMRRVLGQICGRKAQQADHHFTDQVSDKLFLDVDEIGHSTDLPARNIQRGRDHGVRPYMEYLDLAIKNFITSAGLSYDNYQLARCLTTGAYESGADVDLFVGGLHENHMRGALLGPTFAYIVAEQFRRIKFGDRFFHETDDPIVGFTQEQLSEVKKLSFAHVICRNTDSDAVQPDIFRVQNEKNPKQPCTKYEDIDLTPWKEE